MRERETELARTQCTLQSITQKATRVTYPISGFNQAKEVSTRQSLGKEKINHVQPYKKTWRERWNIYPSQSSFSTMVHVRGGKLNLNVEKQLIYEEKPFLNGNQ